jgi:hypothetical protein
MAGSIGPMDRDLKAFGKRAFAHLGGAALGGLVLGLSLAALSLMALLVPRSSQVGLAFAMIGGLAILQFHYPRHPMGSRRQVPLSWSETLGPQPARFCWGAVLSIGIFTQNRSYLFWGLFPMSLVIDPAMSVVSGSAFGLTRAAVAVLGATALRDPVTACRVLGFRRASDLTSAVSLICLAAFVVGDRFPVW